MHICVRLFSYQVLQDLKYLLHLDFQHQIEHPLQAFLLKIDLTRCTIHHTQVVPLVWIAFTCSSYLSTEFPDYFFFHFQTENNLFGDHYQSHIAGNPGDIEFIDPAILAVGKGRMPGVNDSGLDLKSGFPAQYSTPNTDPRIQLLMQQSISSHQNLRLPNHIQDGFLPINDNFVTSRFLAQNNGALSPLELMSLQQPRNNNFINGQWDGWSDIRAGNNMGINEMLRTERFGLNNYYSNNEEPKFHIPRSGDLYNRAFGM